MTRLVRLVCIVSTILIGSEATIESLSIELVPTALRGTAVVNRGGRR